MHKFLFLNLKEQFCTWLTVCLSGILAVSCTKTSTFILGRTCFRQFWMDSFAFCEYASYFPIKKKIFFKKYI